MKGLAVAAESEQGRALIARRDFIAWGTLALALQPALIRPTSAQARTAGIPAGAGDFDFLHGRWRVQHRRLRSWLTGSKDWYEFSGSLEVEPILGGLGNYDRNVVDAPSGTYEATSLRLFNLSNGLWSIWWIDGRAPAIESPVVGGFEDRRGEFFVDEFFQGRPVRVRTTYEALSPEHAQWTQAFSTDAGGSWEINWYMEFQRT